MLLTKLDKTIADKIFLSGSSTWFRHNYIPLFLKNLGLSHFYNLSIDFKQNLY